MYALVSLFTLLAMMGMVEGLRGKGRGWWALHVCANAGLLASHYFTVFLLPVQGIAMIVWERRFTRRLLYWSLFQGLLLVTLLLWVSRIPRQAEDLYSYYSMPSLGTVLTHLLAKDSTTLSASAFFPSSRAWYWLPGHWGATLRGAHPYFDFALMGVSLAAFLAAAFALFYHLRQKNAGHAWTWLLLLLWVFLPTLLLVAVSWSWQPIYGSRYVMYSSFALYLIAGGLVSRLRSLYAYRAVLLLLIGIFGYQLGLALPAETRTAWRQALEKVRENGTGETVLLLEDPFWLPVLEMNADKGAEVPVAAAFKRDTLCEAASFVNSLCKDGGQVFVLLVLTTDFDETPFVQCLLERALFYDRYFFPGERKLALYRVRDKGRSKEPAGERIAADGALFKPLLPFLAQDTPMEAGNAFREYIRYLPDESGGFWLRLGSSLASGGREAMADAVFRRAVREYGTAAYELLKFALKSGVEPDGERFVSSMIQNAWDVDGICARLRSVLQLAAYDKDSRLTELLGRAAMNVAPQCAESHLFMGLALYHRESHLEAVPYFEQGYRLNPKISPEIAEAYGISLAATGAFERAIQVFRDALETWPDFNWLQMRLGIVYADMGRHTEAVEAFRLALIPVPDDFYITYLLMQSLLALRQYDQALPLAQRPVLIERKEPWVHLARWRVFVGAGSHGEAEQALKVLAGVAPDFEGLYDTLYRRPNLEQAKKLLEAARKDNDPIVNELALAVAHLE